MSTSLALHITFEYSSVSTHSYLLHTHWSPTQRNPQKVKTRVYTLQLKFETKIPWVMTHHLNKKLHSEKSHV